MLFVNPISLWVRLQNNVQRIFFLRNGITDLTNKLTTLFYAGLGNSAADIAVELSRHASQVYLSTHRGAWVISRLEKRGLPWDQHVETRFFQNLPSKIKEWLSLRSAQKRFDHETYGLLPHHGILNAPTVISDDLPLRIATGTIKLQPGVSHFTKNGVVFTDGTRLENLNAVIACTGYDICFEFLKDKYILPVEENQVSLYKQVFPPHHPKSTLAVMGLIQSSGAFFPAAELQARWVTRVFKGLARLPSKEVMLHNIGLEKRMLRQIFYASRRLTIQARKKCLILPRQVITKHQLLCVSIHFPHKHPPFCKRKKACAKFSLL